jgi:drug/metabolite transporter (DMT)-like permease
MTVATYARAAYDPALLIFFGVLLVVVGIVMLVFPRFFARLRARGWPGTREATGSDVRYARLWAIGIVVAGAICLVIALVRGLLAPAS